MLFRNQGKILRSREMRNSDASCVKDFRVCRRFSVQYGSPLPGAAVLGQVWMPLFKVLDEWDWMQTSACM